MPDKKLTDSEIKKALECRKEDMICAVVDEDNRTHFVTNGDVLSLINRLQAENERLCAEVDELIIAKDLLFDEAEALIKKAKVEAYKEFAERLKDMHKHNTTSVVSLVTVFDNINNLLKELVGENNETKTF